MVHLYWIIFELIDQRTLLFHYSMLHLPGDDQGVEGDHGCVYAVQQDGLPAAIPRDLCPATRTIVRGGRQLFGQCQVLRVLPASLQ